MSKTQDLKAPPAATPIEGLITPHDSRVVKVFEPDEPRPNPQNPRGPVAEKDVQDLLELIRVFGQKVPGLVRPMPDGTTQVVLGHRRRVVAKILGREFLAFVEELSDDVALALMLSEQGSAKAFDAFAESDAVAELLGRPGWDLAAVGSALGKLPRWVAARANLRTLTKGARKELEKNSRFVSWPIEMMEEIAKLAPDTQLETLSHLPYNVHSAEALEKHLLANLHVLDKAPFDLDDVGLLPAAGPCTTCPKNSARSPGLFDDGLEPIDVRKGTCRDIGCFERKVEKTSAKKLLELRAENPKAIALAPQGVREIKGVSGVVNRWEYVEAKKGEKGAIPAVDFETAKTVHMIPRDRGSLRNEAKDKPKKKPGTEVSEKERERLSRAQVHDQRLAHVVDAVRDLIAKEKEPPAGLEGLIAAYGVDRKLAYGVKLKERKKLFALGEAPMESWGSEIWLRMRAWVAESLARTGGLSQVSEVHELAVWLAELLSIDVGKLEAEAREAIADKKFWKSNDYAKSPAAKAKAKREGKLPTLVPKRLGSCRGCKKSGAGDEPWPEPDLCPSCAGPQPKGKPKKTSSKTKA